MKKNLQKLWMLAVLMVFGTVSSWALTADLSLNYELAGYKAKAFYDFTGNADGVLPTAGDLRFRSGYGLYNYGSGNRSGDAAIAVNESDLIVCQFADTQNRGVTINSISGCTKSTTLNDGSHIFFTADSELSTLTFGVGRGGCVVSVLIMEVDNDVATADYTLNYVYNSETVKSLTGTLAVGGTLQTDASFFVDEVKYFRADGEPGSFTIAADNNTFTVNVRLAATYNYTLTDNFGATIASGSGFEGEKATAAYPRYLLKDDKFYEADVTNKEYRKSITLDADNATATVEYTLKEGVNAVFYAEGENVSGMTATTIGNVPVRASNALAGVSTENVTITTLAPGKYKLHAGIFASKSSYEGKVVNFGIGESIFAAGFNGVNLNEVTSEEYTLNAETSVTFISEDTWVDAQFDYIWIEKTGDVDLELIAAKTALQAAINEAKAIDTTDKEGVDALNTAISTAEEALSAENATVESLTNAKNALAEAVAAFEEANKPAFDPATAIVNAGFNPEADPLGWDKVTSGSYYDLGMGLIGTYQVRGEHSAATVDETHLATEFAAGLECRWQTNYAAFTQTTAELPAGAYKLTFDVENTNATTTKANYENRFNVTVGETTYADESTEWMNGKSAWTTHTIAFTLTEASPITISLGYGTGSNNFGVGNTPALFVSHLTLEAINSIEIALIDLQAAIEAAQAKAATYTVGTEFFTYAESEIKPLNDAIATAQAAYTAAESAEAVKSAAETLNAFVATFAPKATTPDADKTYTFELRLGGETPLYMALAENGITIAEEATPLKFIETETEGQYELSNEDGTLFVGLAGNNAWTMSTLADKKAAWTFTALPDGAYRINNLVTAGRLVGTNAAEKTAGSSCYADKQTSNGNVDWLIAEYVAPEPVKTDYTEYIVNADLTAAEIGWNAEGTKTSDYKEGAGIVKVGSAAAFDFKQTIENLPAGKYKVTAQAAYRYGDSEQAEYEAMQTENTITKFVQLYATVGTKTVSTLVQNRYDGASDTDLAGEGAVLVNEKYVPNSSNAVKAWFAAGKYVNEVEFNLPAEGAVTIGINRVGTPESDYTVIGPWTLTRLGDAEEEVNPLADAIAELNAAIADAKAIETEGKNGVDELNSAIAAAEAAVNAENATAESLAAAKAALAQAIADFEDANRNIPALAGWTKVKSANIENVADNYYVLVDADSYNYVMSNDATHYRPCYKTLADPVANPSFVWTLEGSDNTFALKSFSTGSYFVQANGWDTSMTGAEGTATFQFTLNNGAYTVKCVQSNALVGHWNDNGASVAEDGESIAANKQAKDAPGFYLYAISKQTYEEAILAARKEATKDASKENAVDITAWIQNADWSGDFGGWARSGSWGNMQWGQKTLEVWNATNVAVKQTLKAVPDGTYKFTVDVISGNDDNKVATAFAIGGTTVNSDPVTAVASAGNYTTMSSEVAGNTLTADNIIVTGGELTVGLNIPAGWIVADNFKLYFYGEDMSQYVDAYHTALAAAQAIDTNSPMNSEVLATLSSALTTYGTVDETDKAALLAATTALSNAASAAETSVAAYAKAKAAIDAAKAEMAATNVYTTEALEAYKAVYDAAEPKYQDGSLTDDEAKALENPTTITGWHDATIVDNFLLSAWDTNPDFQDAPYYINTWSTEGNNDGSDFKVPFFEYWTGDGNSLGEKTLTATMNNLEAGNYEVKAWVRVRIKNGAEAPAAGITFQANDGEAVNAADGAQIGESQFYLKEVVATGTVAEDGVLNIKFNVASENNISWLSFKNVWFEKVEAPEPPVERNWIVFTEAAAKGALAEQYTSTDGDLILNYVDTDNKIEIDANNAFFGTADSFDKFSYRMKTGGKSSNKNNITLTIPDEKQLNIYVRTASNSATDRNLVLTQNGKEIYNKVVKEEDAIEVEMGGENPTMVYPVVKVYVTTGTVEVTYPTGGLNFYGFELTAVPTGINDLKQTNVLEGTIYNLNGQKVEKTKKGLYIINGKKVVIK